MLYDVYLSYVVYYIMLSRECAYGTSNDGVLAFDEIFNEAYDWFHPSSGVYLV